MPGAGPEPRCRRRHLLGIVPQTVTTPARRPRPSVHNLEARAQAADEVPQPGPMDVSRALREVRRRQGWSQRELARRSGVSPRAVAALEAGERQPTLALLRRLVEAGGVELALDLAPAEVEEASRVHLRRSLTQRLHRAVGGDGRPQVRRRPPLWQQLVRLRACGRIVLHEDLALALWLPPAEPLQQAVVCLTPSPSWPADRLRPSTPDLDVLVDCDLHPPGLVEVSLECWSVMVESPADLALSRPGHRPQLRAVAALLHDRAVRDEAGRRVRAHADPHHGAESREVFHTKRFGSLPMPPEADRRSWRLDDDASLGAWLRRYGYPA